ncbi:response regulator [Salinigranum halophilum]|uniref:response regulator n=1 Tax=Salinigranum halophilum TaxID=2565931 RepID=UPI00191BD4E6|nr:response regulator [Salinigranum halophilum]
MTDCVLPADGACLLVFEDNPGDVHLIEEGVAAAPTDVTLQVIANGTDAIEWLAADRRLVDLDLVLLDLNLPGRSGFEVLDALRDRASSHTPVVVLSSSENPEDIAAAYEAGANAYVMKPTDPDTFIETVVATMRFWIPEVTPSTHD